MEKKDYYKILGVLSSATKEEIRKAYLKKNIENHPDKLGLNENSEVWKIANDYIKLLNEAYEILSNPQLRKEYDERNIDNKKVKFQEETSKQSSNTNYIISKQTPIIFNYEQIPTQLQRVLKNRQEKDHLYKVKTKGVILSYIGAIILLVWFPILYILSDSSRWKDETAIIYYSISIAISIIIYRLSLFIIKWHKNEIKCNFIVTPLYFIITEFEKITYYFLWDLKGVKATNNYKDGVHQNTSAILFIDKITYDISFSSEREYQNFISLVNGLIKKAATKQSNYEIEYFIENDDLLNFKIPSFITPKINRTKTFIKYGLPVLFAISISTIFYLINKQVSSSPHYISSNSTSSNELAERNNFNEKELPLPHNGTVKYYTYEEPVAPLRIITLSNSNYYVKLEDYYTGKIILSIIIRPYQTIDIDVPLGSYLMKYATGDKWYGEKHLFGPYTSYNKASTRFNFEILGNQYSGYTVELYLQKGGNLRTQEISPSDF